MAAWLTFTFRLATLRDFQCGVGGGLPINPFNRFMLACLSVVYMLKAGWLKYMINVFQLREEFSRVCNESKRTDVLLVMSKIFKGVQERFFTRSGQGQLLHEASHLVGGRRSPPHQWQIQGGGHWAEALCL